MSPERHRSNPSHPDHDYNLFQKQSSQDSPPLLLSSSPLPPQKKNHLETTNQSINETSVVKEEREREREREKETKMQLLLPSLIRPPPLVRTIGIKLIDGESSDLPTAGHQTSQRKKERRKERRKERKKEMRSAETKQKKNATTH